MKNLILILSFLLTFAANAEEMTENRLFGYYKNSTSCAVAYNLQFKIAAVSFCSRRAWEKLIPIPGRIKHTTICVEFTKA